MQPVIQQHLPELKSLCRRFHVRRLELFGSAARGDFDPARSDLDFLVEFERDDKLPALDAYFGLKDALEQLMSRRVDLIMPGAIENPYVKASIQESRETLYASNPGRAPGGMKGRIALDRSFFDPLPEDVLAGWE